MNNRNFSCDLPFLYRVFALFCRIQSPFGKVIGGFAAFRLAARINRLMGGSSIRPLATDGRTILLDLEDPRMLRVPSEIRRKSSDTAMLLELLKPGDTFVDVGANHGSFSVVASEAVGKSGLVIAIESNQRLATMVKSSLNLNNFSHSVVLALACSAKTGQASFYRPYSSSGAAGLLAEYSGREPHEQTIVETMRLDEAFKWRDVTGDIVLKIDVEGSELSVLRGATELMAARTPPIIIEVNAGSLAAAEVSWDSISSELLRAGYKEYAETTTPSIRLNLTSISTARQRNIIVFA